MREKKNNIFYILLLVILVVVLAVVIAMAIHKNQTAGNNPQDSAQNSGEDESTGVTTPTEDWSKDVIKYDGKYYQYNESLHTYLILGIDKDGPVETVEGTTDGGQSDALFLIVTDSETETVSIVSINRNTMTNIFLYEAGSYTNESVVAQICTQHGFGDGGRVSCERTVEAVSKLFTGIPIDGYFSLNMGAIPTMNDGVGGVKLKVLQDLSYPEEGISLKKGEEKTLMGKEAYYYLRGRDINVFDSATNRLKRQEQYLSAFFSKLKTMASGSASDVLKLYESIEDYVVTDVNMLGMVSELMEYTFDSGRMYSIPGETRMGERFEEYHVDENAFHRMIVDVFYEEMDSDN